MNTIRTGLLALAVGLLGGSCGDSEDDQAATVTVTGGSAGAGGDETAGGGATSTGGQAATGGTAGAGGAGGESGTCGTGGESGTCGTGGVMSGAETCAAVCNLLGGASPPLSCVPNPCVETCTGKYDAVAAADPVCADAYLAALSCGLCQPAEAWTCYSIPSTVATIPIPPAATQCDACYVEVQTLYLAILGSNPCLTAFMTMP
jgi:hypothetical protein